MQLFWLPLLMIFVLAATADAAIDALAAANTVRAQGCGGKPGVDSPLRNDKRLAQAARRLSQGTSLQTAMDTATYRAMRSASFHAQGARSAAALQKMLAGGFCRNLTDAAFHEAGVYSRGQDIWLIMATPLVNRNPGNPQAVAQQVVKLTNRARATARRCGQQQFPPARPLRLAAALSAAAAEHSRDMARHTQLRHEGRDGSTPANRVMGQGYKWRTVGENIAVGAVSAEEVVEGWLNSPGHCINIMNDGFSEMGLAFALSNKDPVQVYWTQVLASPAGKSATAKSK